MENSIVSWLSDSSAESVRCTGVTGRKVPWLLLLPPQGDLGPRPAESSRNEDTGLGRQTREERGQPAGPGPLPAAPFRAFLALAVHGVQCEGVCQEASVIACAQA